jgi:hypothetical protein
MVCDECLKADSRLLESLVETDQAETDMRCFFLTHSRTAGVSDLDEYNALRDLEQKSIEQRHRAYLASVEHRRHHGS